jgi:PHS family inorganic phosphate transporter-like MFS transporter
MNANDAERTPLVAKADAEAQYRKDRAATAKVIVTAGAGLVADGYDLSVINLALAIISKLYPERIGPGSKGLIVSLTLTGVIVGQLAFGALADGVGRRVASLTTAGLTVLGAALSALVTDTYGNPWSLCLQLALCRLLLGLGIGGEYPLSAVLAKEVAGDANLLLSRSQLLVVNMTLFNFGCLCQASLVLILVCAGVSLEVIWRVSFAAGLVPSMCALILRYYMTEPGQGSGGDTTHAPEAGQAGLEAQHTLRKGEPERKQGYLNSLLQVLKQQQALLLGTCLSWCLFNFVAYGQGSFSAIVCDAMLGKATDNSSGTIKRDAIFALINSVVAITGNTITFVALTQHNNLSRRGLQMVGFFGLSVVAWLVGGLLHHMNSSQTLAGIYMCANIFSSFIGVSTYLIPSEYFPAASRATCVGISAASGKMGGVIGTAIFPTLFQRAGMNASMTICGFVTFAGFLVTVLLSPRHPSPDGEEADQNTCDYPPQDVKTA